MNQKQNIYNNFIKKNKENFKNDFEKISLFKNQFFYNKLNEKCKHYMYEKNKKISKSIKNLEKNIPELTLLCSICKKYFLNPRNNSIKYDDIKYGNRIEEIFMNYLKNEYGINIVRADIINKSYPDFVILDKNNKPYLYIELKYHAAPFIKSYKYINKYCYESISLDYNKIKKQIKIAKNELEKNVLYLHWIDYPCLKGIFFETIEQVERSLDNKEEFERKERKGDFKNKRKVGYTKKFYPLLSDMKSFNDFIDLYIKKDSEMERNHVIEHNTEDKMYWCKKGYSKEKEFVKKIVPLLNEKIIIHPKKENQVTYIDLLNIDQNRVADLKVQNTPFFTAGKYNYDSQYTITFNKKDYNYYRKKYPNAIIYFWVNWKQLQYKNYKVKPLSGVWEVDFKKLQNKIENNKTPLHCYKFRKNDKKNAKKSYLFDLRTFKKIL
ncbi:MAG: hypothetical protein ACOCP8_03550 [archaeon]